MTEGMAIIPVWILLAAAFGLIIGWAFGELVSQRDCAEEKVEDLRAQLKHAAVPNQERQLREMRSGPTSTSSLFQKVSKDSPDKPHKINSRISPIPPFQKVWV